MSIHEASSLPNEELLQWFLVVTNGKITKQDFLKPSLSYSPRALTPFIPSLLSPVWEISSSSLLPTLPMDSFCVGCFCSIISCSPGTHFLTKFFILLNHPHSFPLNLPHHTPITPLLLPELHLLETDLKEKQPFGYQVHFLSLCRFLFKSYFFCMPSLGCCQTSVHFCLGIIDCICIIHSLDVNRFYYSLG